MGKAAKIFIGILSVWPLLYITFCTQVLLPSLILNGYDGSNIWPLLFLHFLTFLLSCFLFVYYLVKAAGNNKLGQNKALWILGLVFLNAFMWPVYWYFNIWKKVK